MSQAADSRFGWVREISRYQWQVFLIAWLGWSLDSADFGLFALVLRPALTELLGGSPTGADIGRVGGILAMTGLLGWAFGGFVFGVLADYLGRVRTLALSIVIVGVFTGLQGVAQDTTMFGVFRFLTGVGTGAEIVVGIPLVAEAFAETNRAKILGLMMTGGAVGTFLGGFIFAYVGPYGWRYVMFAGILPAFALLIVRLGMEEPEHFQAVRARRMTLKAARAVTEEDRRFMSFVPLQLFGPGVRFNTLVGLLFCLGTLLSIWTSQIWLPTIQTQVLAKSGISGAAATPLVGYGMALWSIGGIAGYASFGFLADAFGRRPAILFYNVGAIASGLFLYQYLQDWDWYPYALPVFGYFVYGVFSGHAVYLPELFPTHIRATAVSFCNGSGRVVTSFGPLVAGLMVGFFGGQFNRAAAVMTCMAVLSILAMAIGRETRDEQLPH